MEAPWLTLYVAARLVACALAFLLLAWTGIEPEDLVLLLYGPLSTAALAASPKLRRSPIAWTVDIAATLALVLESADWRSPYYMLWLTALALPAAYLPLRRAAWLALAAPVAFLLVAIWGGPAPGHLAVTSTETLAIHVTLPAMLVAGLAYVRDTLRRLSDERSERERLALESERRRIAWELHDSAKQRLHAAHLLVSSLSGRVDEAFEPDHLARVGGAGVRGLGHGHEPRRAALAARRPPARGGAARPRLRARA